MSLKREFLETKPPSFGVPFESIIATKMRSLNEFHLDGQQVWLNGECLQGLVSMSYEASTSRSSVLKLELLAEPTGKILLRSKQPTKKEMQMHLLNTLRAITVKRLMSYDQKSFEDILESL